MIRIDTAFLAELDLDGLPPEEADLLLHHIYETLEERVGVRLAGRMSDSQLAEFEVFFESGDNEAASDWLEEEIPDYRDVVQSEFRLLQAELRELAPTIRSVSGGRGK